MAHDQEVVGSNPGTVYWMDVSDASYYIHNNNENKGSQKKKKKKKRSSLEYYFNKIIFLFIQIGRVNNVENINVMFFCIPKIEKRKNGKTENWKIGKLESFV
jgi:hypothetical protein